MKGTNIQMGILIFTQFTRYFVEFDIFLWLCHVYGWVSDQNFTPIVMSEFCCIYLLLHNHTLFGGKQQSEMSEERLEED